MIYLKSLSLVIFVLFSLIENVYAGNKLNVFVSILPQQYFVQQVGTEYIEVQVMVGPGQNPATYDPTPQQMVALANADIYFSIGVPFESAWLDKIKNNNKLTVVECCKWLANLNNHEHSHDHTNYSDPHIWTSPVKVMQITELVKNSLKDKDGINTNSYEKSAAEFINQLQNLDMLVQYKTANLRKRDIIVSHPSWSYFADEYGFNQIAIEQEGKEIQASSMVKLIKLAIENNVKAIFVQPQFNHKAAEVIAKEIDAKILILDPLAFNYIENMINVTNKIVEGLSYE